MGKSGKKQKQQQQRGRNQRGFYSSQADEEERNDVLLPSEDDEEEQQQSEDEENVKEEEEEKNDEDPSKDYPSKFSLYQESVQSPKGDISYLQKFFLMYVGGRLPLHLQEDFCGTALLSAEWLRSDSRRTAVGLDLDLEALDWSLGNNVMKLGPDGYSRISLFHGDVLRPMEAKLVKSSQDEMSLGHLEGNLKNVVLESSSQVEPSDSSKEKLMGNSELPPRDIICAFNYSCCCLQKRPELVQYFKHVLNTLSRKGGIFVMDVYGGTSSEHGLRLQRKFPNFTYIWEQAEFDILHRLTRISLHFNLRNQQKKLRHAFSYSWRLWSLPEIKDCLEEAGFKSVHFWIRQMPDTRDTRNSKGFGVGHDAKYEEVSAFEQQDAWNAYIVGVAN